MAYSSNLFSVLQSRFPTDRDNVAVQTLDGSVYSYGDVETLSARYANRLTTGGIKPGDRVLVQVEKSADALFVYLASIRCGAAYLPLNTAYSSREVAYILADAEPTVVVCTPQSEAWMVAHQEQYGINTVYSMDGEGNGSLKNQPGSTGFETVASEGDDLAALLYTSGTTGQPKGVMLSHHNLASNAKALCAEWGFTSKDVLLHALPLFHTHGLFVAAHCVLMSGSSMIFMNRFDAEQVLDNLPRATVFMGVPTFYTRLLSNPRFEHTDLSHIRLFTSGSAPLLESTFDEFTQRTGQVILERYGMTESGMNTSNPLNGIRKGGTVGLPLPDVQIRIVDEAGNQVGNGEVGGLEIRGPNLFKGYWKLPDKTAEEFTDDGFFRSGDLASMDSDGYIAIVGRNKDLIISGGFNVYPKEVELELDDLAGVKESAVIGLPDPDFGEAVTAVIVALDPAHPPDTAALHQALKQTLANYKVPKRIEIIDALPRNAMGKVQKNVLRATFTT